MSIMIIDNVINHQWLFMMTSELAVMVDWRLRIDNDYLIVDSHDDDGDKNEVDVDVDVEEDNGSNDGGK